MLVTKARRITRESRKAYGLPIFPGVSCEEKNEGIPVNSKKTHSMGVFFCVCVFETGTHM